MQLASQPHWMKLTFKSIGLSSVDLPLPLSLPTSPLFSGEPIPTHNEEIFLDWLDLKGWAGIMVKETTAFKKRELLTHMGKQKSRDDME